MGEFVCGCVCSCELFSLLFINFAYVNVGALICVGCKGKYIIMRKSEFCVSVGLSLRA